MDRAQREYGVEYVRSRVAQIDEDEDGGLVFHYEDESTSRPQQLKVDLAVLATSLVPGPGVTALAEKLDLELDEYGFFRTNPFSPTDTTREGIFTCGCCRGPADIPQSVAQASGAAGRAAQFVMEVASVEERAEETGG